MIKQLKLKQENFTDDPSVRFLRINSVEFVYLVRNGEQVKEEVDIPIEEASQLYIQLISEASKIATIKYQLSYDGENWSRSCKLEFKFNGYICGKKQAVRHTVSDVVRTYFTPVGKINYDALYVELTSAGLIKPYSEVVVVPVLKHGGLRLPADDRVLVNNIKVKTFGSQAKVIKIRRTGSKCLEVMPMEGVDLNEFNVYVLYQKPELYSGHHVVSISSNGTVLDTPRVGDFRILGVEYDKLWSDWYEANVRELKNKYDESTRRGNCACD